MIYSEPERKGRYLALWQSIYQLATIVGGAINLALNIRGTTGAGLSPQTYLVFVGLNCLAPFVSFLVSNPGQVQRKDGKPVPAFPSGGFWEETWATIMELKNPRIVACECSRTTQSWHKLIYRRFPLEPMPVHSFVPLHLPRTP